VIFGNGFCYPFDLRQWIVLSLWSSAMDFAIPLIFGNEFCYPFDLRQWILLSLWSSAMDFTIPLIFGNGFCYPFDLRQWILLSLWSLAMDFTIPLIILLTVIFKLFPIASTVHTKLDIYIVITKCQYETYTLCHLNIILINYIFSHYLWYVLWHPRQSGRWTDLKMTNIKTYDQVFDGKMSSKHSYYICT
jgi:hypothetical protein